MERRIFRGAVALRIAVPAIFVLLAVLEIPSVFNGGKGGVGAQIFASVIAVVCAVFFVRGIRSATLIADDGGLCYRSLLSTRRWSWERVGHVEVEVGAIGMSGIQRRYLVLLDTAGARNKLTELNAPRNASPDRITTIAGEINRLVPGTT